VPMNWVAPPGNKPIGIKGSQTPSYSGGTTYHYVCAMGIDDAYPGGAVWIADSGFQPFNYWISFDQCATLIPPKGYTYATAPINATIPPPTADLDYEQLEYEQLAGPVGGDGYGHGWPQLGGLSVTDALASIKRTLEGTPPVPPPDGGQPADRHALLTCSGTWAAPGIGYPSDVANACLDQESVQTGVDWACDWVLAHPHRTFLLGGYSQGGECAARIRQELEPAGRLEAYRGNFVGGFTFGNPSRQEGHTFYAGPPRNGEGIAAYRQSGMGDDWADEIDQGDMYGAVPTNLTGEIMRDVYTMVTEMQLHDGFVEFAHDFVDACIELLGNLDGDAYDQAMAEAARQGVSFEGASRLDNERMQQLVDTVRARISDRDGKLSVKGIAAAIAAAVRAITFFAQGTAPHVNYHAWEVFPGQTYLDHCIQHVHYWAGTRAPTQ
jgi:hypothetical protein